MGHYDDEPDWVYRNGQKSDARRKLKEPLKKKAEKIASKSPLVEEIYEADSKLSKLKAQVKLAELEVNELQAKYTKLVDKEFKKLFRAKYENEENFDALAEVYRKKMFGSGYVK